VPVVAALAAACKSSLERYGDVPALAAAVLERPTLDDDTRRVLAAVGERLALFAELRRRAPQPYLAADEARGLLGDYRRQGKERLALGPRDLLMPLRQALTGRDHGPELHFVLAALSAGETLTRLAATVDGIAAGGDDSPAAAPAAAPPAVTTEGDRR
jgi:hypothetical protein